MLFIKLFLSRNHYLGHAHCKWREYTPMKRKHTEKFSVFEASGGTYSTRKIPPWHMGHNDLLKYLDYSNTDDGEDYTVQINSA